MKRQWSVILAIVLILIISILAVLNVDPVSINFGFTQVEMPLILLILGMLLLGALVTVILSTTKSFSDRQNYKKLEQEYQELKKTQAHKLAELDEKHQKELTQLLAEKEREIESLKQQAQTNADGR